ncbi:transcription factor gte6 [Nicotiana attenuata]|uniref:Transcription factor gte6 n=1 Tax=Nicotiana attenuata TaxID=49451 RepID=A0A1J6ISP9_NICAT|nr:transcription factor gte6 [Nicotiana attenuata]
MPYLLNYLQYKARRRRQRELMDETRRRKLMEDHLHLQASESQSFMSQLRSEISQKTEWPLVDLTSIEPSALHREMFQGSSNSIAGQIVQPGADLLTEQNLRKDWKISSSISSASRKRTFDLELPAEEYVDIEDKEQCVEESPVQGPNILISELQPQHSSKVNFVNPGDSSISNSTPRVDAIHSEAAADGKGAGQNIKVVPKAITDRVENKAVVMQELKEKKNADSVENFSQRVDEMVGKVDQLEQRLNDDASRREAAGARRMQELVRQFGTILRQITQHKWAEPFMEPVYVEGLGLHDYFEVIEKPMDFITIKRKMEAKDGSCYKHVREISADVRLIFKNAMKYNEERHDVHVMAKTLLGKFEEKWLQLLPKVDEEEKRRKEEEAEVQQDMQLAQEAAHAKIANDLSIELDEVDMQLEELREMVLQKCRKMSTEDKKKLGNGLTRLSPEDLQEINTNT